MRILVAIITLMLLGCTGGAEADRSDTQTVSASTAEAGQPTPETEQTTPAQTTPAQTTPAQTTTVMTDEGSGAGRTQQFTVDGSFEVRWAFTSDQLQGKPVGYIGITLESVDGEFVEGGGLVANQTGSGQDVWHGQTGGTYVLGINAANGSWTVEVVDTP